MTYRSGTEAYPPHPELSWRPYGEPGRVAGQYVEAQGVWDENGEMIDKRILLFLPGRVEPLVYILDDNSKVED